MRIILASFLALSLMAGCGGVQVQDHTQTQQNTTGTGSDRYLVKEYDTHRAYMYSQNNNTVQHPDLAIRLSNEAERVFNVSRAVTIINGRDIIMGITTKADPLHPHSETIKKVRQRLENKEPTLNSYNLHITGDPIMQQEIMKARTFLENAGPDDYSKKQSKQHFYSILHKMDKSRRY